MKYIELFESFNKNIKILSTSDNFAKIINPDGKEVEVEFDEDGQWSEWIDPPYVKEVSIVGDDGKYQYTASASTDGQNTFFEINTDYGLEVELMSEVKAREEKRRLKIEAQRLERERIEREKEESIAREIKDQGISRIDYEIRKLAKNQLESQKNRGVSQTGDLTDYALVKVRQFDGEYYTSTYIKVNLSGMSPENLKSNFLAFQDLGMEEVADSIIDGLPQDGEVIDIISKDSDITILYDSLRKYKLKDLKEYLDLMPFGSSVYPVMSIISKYNKS
jgi:hypothetical protein